jgi:hypothetical protein
MLIRVFFVFSIGIAVASAEQTAKWEWEGVPRIVAMGDVHGNIDKLTTILQGTGIVDASLRWTGGDAHVVLCGDLIDRGHADRSSRRAMRTSRKKSAPRIDGKPGTPSRNPTRRRGSRTTS